MIHPPPTHYMAPEEITAWRNTLHLSKRKASALLGCSRASLFAWESGKRPVPKKIMLAMQAVSSMKAAA